MTILTSRNDIDLRAASGSIRVLFATAEYAPLVKVGGLGEASSGLVSGLRSTGMEVDVVMPDYGTIELIEPTEHPVLGLPDWAPRMVARRGWVPGVGELTLLRFPGSFRPSPYNDPATGDAWADSAEMFFTFSVGVAALADDGVHASSEVNQGSTVRRYDIVHCNDWHTGAAIALLPEGVRSVLTIHNLAYQGQSEPWWESRFGPKGVAYRQFGQFNPLAGAVSLADRVVMVSESYASEVVVEAGGCGLHNRLMERRSNLSGIRNGIDLGLWNPADDPLLPYAFDSQDLSGKELCRKELLRMAGLESERGPVIGMVARMVHQKGIDLALDVVPFLDSLPARFILTGSGSPSLTAMAEEVARRHPDVFAFIPGYEEEFAHLVVAGSDLFLVPSRFEPCGLTQMQAMTCGTIPVVNGVGGLRDTVRDTDQNPRSGTGFVAHEPTSLGLIDAVHRASRGWSNPRRRAAVQRRGMTADWSWAKPAARYIELYRQLVDVADDGVGADLAGRNNTSTLAV